MNLEIVQPFMLTQSEKNQLEECITFYQGRWNCSNLFPRIWDAICHLFGQSTWQQTRNLLEHHTFHLVQTEISVPRTNQETLRLRAHHLSEFILKYLSGSIPQKENTMSFADFFEHAAYGDGTHIGTSPRVQLQKEVIDLYTGYVNSYNAFQNHLQTDPQLQQVRQLMAQANALMGRLGQAAPPNEMEQMVSQLVASVQNTLAIYQGIENKLDGMSISQIEACRAELQTISQAFDDCVAKLRTPVRGFF